MDLEQIEQQYRSNLSLYSLFCEEVVKQLQVLLDRGEIQLAVPIDYRVKEWDSIKNKIERKNKKVTDIKEIKDICGIRTVLLFKKDIEKVQEIIKENFKVCGEDDTSTRLSENQFGYGSIHYEIKLKDSWIHVPAFTNMGGFLAEIQVRTAAQHIWAATSHVLQYKKEEHVPQELRRSISRAAALLEVVDLEFERVLMERKNLLNKEVDTDSPINTDTLRKLLDKYFPEKNKMESETFGEVVDELLDLGIKSIGQLNIIINKHLEDVLRLDRIICAKLQDRIGDTNSYDISTEAFYSYAGLLRNILKLESTEDYNSLLDSQLGEIGKMLDSILEDVD